MPFQTGTSPASNSFEEAYELLFRAFRRYVSGAPLPGTPTDPGTANTGNGTFFMFDTKQGGTPQTWTFVCTAAGSPATFSVTGSVSGAQAALTTNVFYENSQIACYLNQGGTPFVAGGTPDDFQVITSTNPIDGTNSEWVIDEYDYDGDTAIGGGAGRHGCVMHGVGLAGGEGIYLGFRLVQTPGNDEYNWEFRAYTGYQAGQTFTLQPGASGTSSFIAFHTNTIEYWFVVNGRRVIVVGQSGSTYHSMYGGLFLPLTTPLEYPYPIFQGGCDNVQYAFDENADATVRGFWDPQGGSRFRLQAGTYSGGIDNTTTTGYVTWPYFSTTVDSLANMQHLSGGEYPILPVTIAYRDTGDYVNSDVIGELDGVFAVTGHELNAEDLIDIGAEDCLAVPNVFRITRRDFAAIRLS